MHPASLSFDTTVKMKYNDGQTTMQPNAQNLILKKDWLYALLATALAAIPRLCCLNVIEFKHDEAKHYRTIYFLTHGAWRWVGADSSQAPFPKPPLFTYTLAIPMALSRDPRIVTGFLGVLAALAAGLLYLTLCRFMKKRAAFAAALLFASNPQAILYSRKLFTADLLPPLCTLFLASGAAFLISSRRDIGRSAILAAFTFALLVMTTFSPMLLLPALALLFLERRRDLKPAHLAGACAAVFAPFIPYLIAITPKLPAMRASDTGEAITAPPPILAWIWSLLQGIPWPVHPLSIDGLVACALLILSLAGLGFLLGKARTKEASWSRFFLAWLILSSLLALLVPFQIHPHYLVILYPTLFILPAAGIEIVSQKANRAGWVAFFLVIAIAIWGIWHFGQTLQAAASGTEWFGTPLGYWQRAAQQARSLFKQERADEILLIMPGDETWDQKGYGLSALLSDTPHRVVDGQNVIVYPPHRSVIVIASEVNRARALLAPCTQDLGKDLAASPFGGTYAYYLWDPDQAHAALCTESLIAADAQWTSGTRLRGYNVSGAIEPGSTLQVTIYWETTTGPIDTDVHWFNHLEDQEGQRWAQLDMEGWPTENWRPGDRILTHFDLSIAADAAPGPYILRVGQYAYRSPEDIENIPVIDTAGNPADYAVTLPIPE
jgi:hypothetical protein